MQSQSHSSNGSLPKKQFTESKLSAETANIQSKSQPRLIGSTWESWLSQYGLKSSKDVPPSCRERYITSGYRPSPCTWSYCVRSAFHPTNETLNVWTHAIPCILMMGHYYNFAITHLDDVTNSITYPYWFFVLGVLVVLFGSACAHLFNCLSPGTREVCFCCDYGVISLQAIGLTCSFTFYLCPYSCVTLWPGMLHATYLLIMLGNITTVISSCSTRYPDVPHKNLIRVMSYVIMYSALNIPCVYRYSTADTSANTTSRSTSNLPPACTFAASSSSASYFNETCLVMLLGAVVQALKIPERWRPGCFDFFGHSHQIFHLLTAAGLYYQSLLIEPALLEALESNKSGHLQAEDLHINWFTALFVPGASAFLSCVAAVYYSADLYKSHARQKIL